MLSTALGIKEALNKSDHKVCLSRRGRQKYEAKAPAEGLCWPASSVLAALSTWSVLNRWVQLLPRAVISRAALQAIEKPIVGRRKTGVSVVLDRKPGPAIDSIYHQVMFNVT